MCEALASLVFPAPCRICKRILDTGSRIPFCHGCIEAIREPLREPLCSKCGEPYRLNSGYGRNFPPTVPHLPEAGVHAFDMARSFGVYTPRMSRAILLLKYGNVTPLGGWFARILADLIPKQSEDFAADAVVPVPLDRGSGFGKGAIIKPNLSQNPWPACWGYLFGPICWFARVPGPIIYV